MLVIVGVSHHVMTRIRHSTDCAQAIAFLAGYITNNITNTLWFGLGGTALTFFVVVPPWPFFNKHPLNWLPARKGAVNTSGYNIVVDGKKVQ